MPTGLEPGAYDEQDAVAITYWLNVMSAEASEREALEIMANRKREQASKRKR